MKIFISRKKFISRTCRTCGDRPHITCCLGVRWAVLQFFSALAGPMTPAAICGWPSMPISCVTALNLGSTPKYLKANPTINMHQCYRLNSLPKFQIKFLTVHLYLFCFFNTFLIHSRFHKKII